MSASKKHSVQNIPNNYASDSISDPTIHVQTPIVPSEFADDVENRLGRANGNTFVSKPGVDQVHDGQIMVRLKKKRFIIIDYGMAYTSTEKKICNSPNCNKIGVPILLFDSAPTETPSLYMRSGLCFTCQRLLNEKRRTQRKRKSVDKNPTNSIINSHQANRDTKRKPAPSRNDLYCGSYGRPTLSQTYKIGDQIVTLPNDAIIICGPLEGTKRIGLDYTMKNISSDIRKFSKEIVEDTNRLFTLVENAADKSNPNSTNIFSSDYTAVLSTKGTTLDAKNLGKDYLTNSPNTCDATIKLNNDKDFDGGDSSMSIPLSSQVNAMYEKAFITMKKSIFLLSQWKSSWDAIEQQRRYQQHQQELQELHQRRFEELREMSKSTSKDNRSFDPPTPFTIGQSNKNLTVESTMSKVAESTFIDTNMQDSMIDTTISGNILGSEKTLDRGLKSDGKGESHNTSSEIYSVQV